jgi:hypothetical protein
MGDDSEMLSDSTGKQLKRSSWIYGLRFGERTRPRVQFPASRRKTLFGETPNITRGTLRDAYAPHEPSIRILAQGRRMLIQATEITSRLHTSGSSDIRIRTLLALSVY